jgi:hypothetical protein
MAFPTCHMQTPHQAPQVASAGILGGLAILKLCCPMCWHLLALMDPPIGRFGVRGHHLKVIPALLPPWIPKIDAQAMLDIFWRQLCDELSTMLETSCSRRASGMSSSTMQIIGCIASQSTTTSSDGPSCLGFLPFDFKCLWKVLPFKFKLPMWND